MRPFDLDRRHRQEQRAGEIALRADAGLGDRFLGHHVGHALAELGRAERLDRNEVDRAGDRGLQPVGRKAADRADAGLPGGQLAPVVGLADAERGQDADAGDGDGRAGRRMPCAVLLHARRFDQRHAFAAPVPDAGHDHLGERPVHGRLGPDERRCKQLFMSQRQRCKRNVHGELRLETVADMGAGGAHRNIGHGRQPGALLGGRGLGAGRAGDHRDRPGSESRGKARPHPRRAQPSRRPAAVACGRTARSTSRASGLALRAVACSRASSTRNAPSEPSAMPPPRAARSQTGANGAFKAWPPASIEQQHVLALAIVGAADQA